MDVPNYLQPNTQENTNLAAPQAPQMQENIPVQTESVFDTKNGAEMNIPQQDFEVAVRSGIYAPQKDKAYVVKSPEGSIHTVQGSNLNSVLAQQYTMASPEESLVHTRNIKYGDQEIKATLEATIRGALPVLGDKLSKWAGEVSSTPITDEDLIGRKEANPVASAIGEGVGFVGSPIGKGISALGKSVTGLAEGAILKYAAKAGIKNSVASAIATKALAYGAGGAYEGSILGVANLANEAALGTAEFNAENVLGSIESGAIWGAALGAGIGGAGEAVVQATPFIKKGIASIEEFSNKQLKKYANAENAAYDLAGITDAKAFKMEQRNENVGKDLVDYFKEKFSENPKLKGEELASAVSADRKIVGSNIGKLHDAIDAALHDAPELIPTKKSYFQRLSQSVREEADRLKGVEGSASTMKRMYKQSSDLAEQAMAAEGSMSVKEAHDLYRQVTGQINFEAKNLAKVTGKEEILRAQKDLLRDIIDESAKNAEQVSPYLKASEFSQGVSGKLKELNAKFSLIAQIEEPLAKRASKLAGESVLDKLFSPMKAIKGAVESDTVRKMKILGKIESPALEYASKMGRALKSLYNKGESISEKYLPTQEVRKSVLLKTLVDSDLSAVYEDGRKRKAKNEQEAYANILSNATRYVQNPEALQKNLNRYSSSYYEHAPETSAALDAKALTALAYIAAQTKKGTRETGLFDSGKDHKVSGQAMAELKRKISIIENPHAVPELLRSGKLSRDHVDALKNVYPEIYKKTQQHTLDFLGTKKGQMLPYNKKLNLGLLLDVKADESMNFEAVLGLQKAFITEPTQGQKTSKLQISKDDKMQSFEEDSGIKNS